MFTFKKKPLSDPIIRIKKLIQWFSEYEQNGIDNVYNIIMYIHWSNKYKIYIGLKYYNIKAGAVSRAC